MEYLIKKKLFEMRKTCLETFCLKSNLGSSGTFNQSRSMATHTTLIPPSVNVLSVGRVPMETGSSLECRCSLGKQSALYACEEIAHARRDVQIPGIRRISRTWNQSGQRHLC